MKKLLIILFISTILSNVTNNGANVTIHEDVTVNIDGNLTLNSGNIDVNGTLNVSGEIISNGGSITGIEILGCTDELACNYNSDANTDNGSCDYTCHDNGNYQISLDGENDYISVDELELYNEFSVGGKFIFHDFQTYNAIFQHKNTCSAAGGWIFGIENNYIRVNINGENDCNNNSGAYNWYVTNYPIPLNEEIDIVLSKQNDGLFRLYINNILVDSNQTNYSINLSNKSLFIGYWLDGSNSHFSNMSILNSFYTETIFIDDDISNYNPNLDQNIIFNFNANEGLGDLMHDSSGNQNHGTIYGAEWVENEVLGCTDELACNYNSDANINDDSCDYTCHDNGDYSLSFDGDDEVVLGDLGNFQNFEIKVQFISYNEEINSTKSIFSINPGIDCEPLISFFINNEGFLEAQIRDDNTDCVGARTILSDFSIASLNGNVNASIKYDNGTFSLLIDNEVVDYLSNINIDLISPNVSARIGSMPYPTTAGQPNFKGFYGEINSLQIFSNNEIIVDYGFHSGSGDILYDHSGNQNHGTIYGATWVENEVLGCTDQSACNYNENANVDDGSCLVNDCLDACGGLSTTDNCGICDDNAENDNTTCVQDCALVWDGSSSLDNCGVCDDNPENDNTTCVQDCALVWGGNAITDECGVCDDDSSNNNTSCEQDCEGNWDGTVENDCKGVCGGTAIDGDVNQTDFLNIADVVYIVHLILGSDLDSACADVNNDGYINISDVVKLVEIVLDL